MDLLHRIRAGWLYLKPHLRLALSVTYAFAVLCSGLPRTMKNGFYWPDYLFSIFVIGFLVAVIFGMVLWIAGVEALNVAAESQEKIENKTA